MKTVTAVLTVVQMTLTAFRLHATEVAPLRVGTPAELHENVITVYDGSTEWKARLGVTDASKDDAFLIVLDRVGTVRRLHHGRFETEAASTLKDALMSARSRNLSH